MAEKLSWRQEAKIENTLRMKNLLLKYYPKILKEGGIDFDGKSGIKDREKIQDEDHNGQFSLDEYYKFIAANADRIRKEVVIISTDYLGDEHAVYAAGMLKDDTFLNNGTREYFCEKVCPVLIKYLKYNKVGDSKIDVLNALEEFEDERAVPAIADVLLKDEDSLSKRRSN